jgi:hypothetical protein
MQCKCRKINNNVKTFNSLLISRTKWQNNKYTFSIFKWYLLQLSTISQSLSYMAYTLIKQYIHTSKTNHALRIIHVRGQWWGKSVVSDGENFHGKLPDRRDGSSRSAKILECYQYHLLTKSRAKLAKNTLTTRPTGAGNRDSSAQP